MSLVPVNIKIDFTADYAGVHRACYRLAGSGSAYTCVNVSCALGSCEALIPIFVDNETCIDVQYEGYVQAACQDINSTVGRVAWTYSFVPAPSCKNYTVTCLNEGVASASMMAVGTGYVPAAPPAVLFTGGGGTGAAATAVVGFGAVQALSIVTPGTGYTSGTYNNVRITGGSGTGAMAKVVITAGAVASISITTVGTGYLTLDAVGINAADAGGTVVTPYAGKITSDYGEVNSLTITNAGSGYTSAPVITIAPSDSGGAATASAVLSTCPDFTDNGCSGAPVVIPQGTLPVGSSMSVCSKVGPPVVSNNFSVALNGNCLCACTLTTIGVSGPVGTSIRYFYTNCGGAVVTGLLTVGGSPSSIIVCAVTGSVVFQSLVDGTTGTISLGGAC